MSAVTNKNNMCPICLDDIDPKDPLYYCGKVQEIINNDDFLTLSIFPACVHGFHSKCSLDPLNNIRKKDSTEIKILNCPLCRIPFTEIIEGYSTREKEMKFFDLCSRERCLELIGSMFSLPMEKFTVQIEKILLFINKRNFDVSEKDLYQAALRYYEKNALENAEILIQLGIKKDFSFLRFFYSRIFYLEHCKSKDGELFDKLIQQHSKKNLLLPYIYLSQYHEYTLQINELIRNADNSYGEDHMEIDQVGGQDVEEVDIDHMEIEQVGGQDVEEVDVEKCIKNMLEKNKMLIKNAISSLVTIKHTKYFSHAKYLLKCILETIEKNEYLQTNDIMSQIYQVLINLENDLPKLPKENIEEVKDCFKDFVFSFFHLMSIKALQAKEPSHEDVIFFNIFIPSFLKFLKKNIENEKQNIVDISIEFFDKLFKKLEQKEIDDDVLFCFLDKFDGKITDDEMFMLISAYLSTLINFSIETNRPIKNIDRIANLLVYYLDRMNDKKMALSFIKRMLKKNIDNQKLSQINSKFIKLYHSILQTDSKMVLEEDELDTLVFLFYLLKQKNSTINKITQQFLNEFYRTKREYLIKYFCDIQKESILFQFISDCTLMSSFSKIRYFSQILNYLSSLKNSCFDEKRKKLVNIKIIEVMRYIEKQFSEFSQQEFSVPKQIKMKVLQIMFSSYLIAKKDEKIELTLKELITKINPIKNLEKKIDIYLSFIQLDSGESQGTNILYKNIYKILSSIQDDKTLILIVEKVLSLIYVNDSNVKFHPLLGEVLSYLANDKNAVSYVLKNIQNFYEKVQLFNSNMMPFDFLEDCNDQTIEKNSNSISFYNWKIIVQTLFFSLNTVKYEQILSYIKNIKDGERKTVLIETVLETLQKKEFSSNEEEGQRQAFINKLSELLSSPPMQERNVRRKIFFK